MTMKHQIPIVLLTGFLGSGKTTLLASWLHAPELSGAMVIVNELGEVGLDHMLLETASDTPLLLENGCICCAASDDLASTIERLFWERLHRRIPRFEWVLIETTGIADPAPIVDMLRTHQLIGERYRVVGVVSTFDAVRGKDHLTEFPECRRQLETATVVVITKSDLVDVARLEAARDVVARSAPGATVLSSRSGDLDASRLLGALGEARSPESSATCSEAHINCDGVHAHEQPQTKGAVHAIHKEGVSTAFADLPGCISWSALQAVLPVFLTSNEHTLLRLKGGVVLDDGGYYAIQAMPGEPIDRHPIPLGPSALAYRTGFTIIASRTPASDLVRDLKVRLDSHMAAERATPEPSRSGA